MNLSRWLLPLLLIFLAACETTSSPTVAEAPSVASIQLSQNQLTLGVGGTAALQALVRDGGGRSLSDQVVFWSSSDSTVARVSASGVVTAVTPGTAQIAATAAGRSAVAVVVVAPQAVASVVVSPSQPKMLVGEQVKLSAQTFDANGAVLDGRLVTWSTNNSTIASVNADGTVTGIAAGVANIVATSEGRTATVGVTVSLVPVATLSIAPTDDTITVSQSTQLSYTAFDSIGGVLTGRHVMWQSSSAAIATVSSLGSVMGVSPGTAVITASSEGKTTTAKIVVQPRPVGAVIVSPSQVALRVGETSQLTTQVTDENGAILSGRPVSYSSVDNSIATVTLNGLVTGVAADATEIVVTSEGKTASASVTVSPVPVAAVNVAPAALDLIVGGSDKLNAVAVDGNGNVLPNRQISWSSGSPGIATVSTDGTVHAVGVGTAVIIASSEGRVGTSTVSVSGVPIGSVVVSPASDTVIIGDMISLTYEVRDLNGTIVTGQSAIWTSSNNTVAAVASDGRVVGVSTGTAVISAIVDGVAGKSTVTVIKEPVLAVTVQPTTLAIFVADTARIVATPRGRNNVPLTDRAVTFASDDASIASVSIDGLVTAHKVGSTSIRVASEGKQATVPVTVSRIPVASVAVTLNPTSLRVGGTAQATATIRDANNNVLTDRAVAWTSSNNEIASINLEGVITTKAVGIATITGTSEGKSTSATLTVTADPVATITVTLTPSTLEVGDGGKATAVLRDGQGRILTGRTVTWNSSEPSVASVNDAGDITAVAAGSATITATSEGKSASATLTVVRPEVATIVVTLSPGSVVELDTTRAYAELRDKNGNVLNGVPVSWSVLNSAVATIASDGLITTHRAGMITVVATVDGKMAIRALNVQEAEVARVEVTPATATIRDRGPMSQRRVQLTAVAYDSKDRPLNRTFLWSTNRLWIAIVDQNGLVTGVSRGDAEIRATVGGKSGTADIHVVRSFNDDDIDSNEEERG